MSKIKISGNASGTGVVTLTAPNTNTDRVITLPDSTGSILDSTSTLDATKLSGTVPNFTSTGIDDNATSTAITIDSSERVGVGTTSPVGKFAVSDGTTTGEINPSGGVCWVGTRSSHDVVMQVGASEKLRLKADGRGLSQFTAKAWVNFNGTGTIAIADSHNISGLYDHGTGDYSVNFINSLANVNYTVVGMGSADGIGGMTVENRVNVDLAVGGYRLSTRKTADAANVDATLVMTQVFGD